MQGRRCKPVALSYLAPLMQKPAVLLHSEPLVFEPIFMERVWGGRSLETLYQKNLPASVRIGESWEIVDRAEAQSIVRGGPGHGCTLHELWMNHRSAIFGQIADAPRFPLLIKLLDAREKLSLQVHPPAKITAELGGEPKTEFWYIAAADRDAELHVGLRPGASREVIERALKQGTVDEHVHRLAVRAGDAMFLPSGRLHSIGAGNVIVEVQQNSDTTYRVFDWNRQDADGSPRQLHVEESLRAIDFEDFEPELARPVGESLLNDALFAIDKWELAEARAAAEPGRMGIIVCLSGIIQCAGVRLRPGEMFLVPAALEERALRPCAENSSLLRITLPG